MKRKILLVDHISTKGLKILADSYAISAKASDPIAMIIRSTMINDEKLNPALLAIAKAGTSVNNIPVDVCTKKGIVVFNAPGANANAVKELVVAGLLLSSRGIVEGINWAKGLIGENEKVPDFIEKGKRNFSGTEISGKKLGIIGLGAIGSLLSKIAREFSMEVLGFDPHLTADSKLRLHRDLSITFNLGRVLAESDYLSLHIPYDPQTKNNLDFIDAKSFALMKPGVKILNFACRELVNTADLKEAIARKKVACYITDFPDEALLKTENVVCIPHLGASTEEAEENCALMAAKQLAEYLENGNIKNSVNFPNCDLERTGDNRLVFSNLNMPGMIEKVTHLLRTSNNNIAGMVNKSRDGIAYNIIDTDNPITKDTVQAITKIKGVIKVRIL